MKKFSVYAVMAMGVLTVSSAAFAGTTAFSSRGLVNTEVSDTVVPKDTVLPEKTETEQTETQTQTEAFYSLTDTVVPQQEETTPQQKEETTPQQEETTTTESSFSMLNDTVVPADTLTPAKKDEPQTDEPQKDEPQQEETAPVQ
ncbi:secreted protein [Prevotella sp. CAG:891]|nr:secreted protein [Prevotella sp. CAG:891]